MNCAKLEQKIKEFARVNGTTNQGALRDFLTDLRTVADTLGVDFNIAVEGSLDVYNEELEEN
jgi:hypothetical protein